MVEEEGPIFMINENARLSGRRALLTLLTEFLLHYTHQVVFVNGGLPSTVFANAHFQGTIVKRCKLPHIVDYIEKLRCSLAHWIAHEKLAQFVLVLFAEEDERMTKVAEFQVHLHSPQRTLPEYELALGDYARQVLKGVTDQLRTILSDVLLAPTPPPVKSLTGRQPIRLRAYCKLADETTSFHISDPDHCWLTIAAKPPWPPGGGKGENNEQNLVFTTPNDYLLSKHAVIKFVNIYSR